MKGWKPRERRKPDFELVVNSNVDVKELNEVKTANLRPVPLIFFNLVW